MKTLVLLDGKHVGQSPLEFDHFENSPWHVISGLQFWPQYFRLCANHGHVPRVANLESRGNVLSNPEQPAL